MSEDADMMDIVPSSRTTMSEQAERTRTNERTTTLAIRSMPSLHTPAELQGAVRIMSHAGRILWRAAMEAIPGRSCNAPLRVLTKLFQRSVGASLLAFGSHATDAPETSLPDDNDEMEDVSPEPTMDDQPRKRKTIWSLLPSVVSDSEGDDDDDESFRPSKRVRRNVEESPVVQYW